MSSLSVEVGSGDQATIKWRNNRTVATLTRSRQMLRSVTTTNRKHSLIVLFGDPSTDAAAQIHTVTLNVSPSTATLSVAAVGLVIEEMLAQSAQDPIMSALMIVGAHQEDVWCFVRDIAKRRGDHIYSMRAPRDAYSTGAIEATLQEVSDQLELALGFKVEIEWEIEADVEL